MASSTLVSREHRRVEKIGSLVEIFHSLSWLVIAALVVLTLVVSVIMISVCRGDFDNVR